MIPSRTAMIAAGAIALFAAGWYIKKKVKAPTAKGAAAAVVGVLGDAAAGVIEGIGGIVGVPATDEAQCQAALRDGRTWDASKFCPAKTFVSSLFSPTTPRPADPGSLLPQLPLDRDQNGTQYDQFGNVIQ